MSLVQKSMTQLKATRLYFKRIWDVLIFEEKKKIVWSVLVLSFSNLMDLVGIFLIGVIGVIGISVTGVGTIDSQGFISGFLNLTRLDSVNTDYQVSTIAISAVALFLIRTYFSMYYVRRIYLYLGTVAARITEQLLSKELNQSVNQLVKENSQSVLYRSVFGVDSLALGVIANSISITADVFLLLLVGSTLCFLNFQVTFLTFLYLALVAFFLNKTLGPKSHNLGFNRAYVSIQINKLFLSTIFSFREVTVKNRKKFLAEEINALRRKQTEVISEIAFLPLVGKYVIEGAFVLGVMVLSFSQFVYNDPKHAVGTIAIFLAAGSRIAPAILRIQNGFMSVRNSIGGSKITLEAIENFSPSVFQHHNILAETLNFEPNFEPTIRCEMLTFSYPGGQKPVIENLNLEIKSGEFLAIIGPSGIGKSTLVDLLLGLLVPTAGKVLVSGVDPKIATQLWEGRIAYVPQEISVFDGSVLENLHFSYPLGTFSPTQMWDSLHFASLDDFVLNHPNGLDLQVGENGNKLSGGQKQRLGLSRAIITNPSILVLDETTSALDHESEEAINQSLSRITGACTVISIAHRVSTLKLATKIIYISESGPKIFSSLSDLHSSDPKIFENSKIFKEIE